MLTEKLQVPVGMQGMENSEEASIPWKQKSLDSLLQKYEKREK